MFPLRDENPTLNTSVATFLIIGLNVISWIFIQGLGFNPGLIKSVFNFGIIPGELLGTVEPGTRIPVGQNIVYIIESHRSWATILTSMFMHGGWFHLIGNMWFLAIFGDNIEDVMGRFRFIAFYLLCGIAAAAAQIISDPASPVPMVGASGAISGVMGAYALLFPRAPVHTLIFLGFFITRIVVPAYIMLGYWFFLQLFSGFLGGGSGGVAVWAHIGGFVAGIVMVRLFCQSSRLQACREKRGATHQIIRRY